MFAAGLLGLLGVGLHYIAGSEIGGDRERTARLRCGRVFGSALGVGAEADFCYYRVMREGTARLASTDIWV